MRVAVFSTRPYDQHFLSRAAEAHGHELTFFEGRLTPETVSLGLGFEAICAFVNDQLGRDVLEPLAESGTRLIALRSAGFNHVDVAAAEELGMTVARVPAYSPHAVAEHAVALILTLNRKTNRAHNRVREGNFSLDGLLGFDLQGKTVGVVGTGKIGTAFARIMHGFGCRVLASDPYPNDDARQWVEYLSTDDVLAKSDIVALHLPLTPDTYHLIDEASIGRMKRGVMLINTSRGALIDTQAVIEALKSGQIGYLGLDVYEEEEEVFFQDMSDRVIQDDVLMRLVTIPNVLITGHQAFFTAEAMNSIAETTINNITAFERGEGDLHRVSAQQVA